MLTKRIQSALAGVQVNHTQTVRHLVLSRDVPIKLPTVEGIEVRVLEARIVDDIPGNRRTVEVWGVPSLSGSAVPPKWFQVPAEPIALLLHNASRKDGKQE